MSVTNYYTNNIIRKALALQVAVLEWERADLDDDEAFKALEVCIKEISKAVKELKKECA